MGERRIQHSLVTHDEHDDRHYGAVHVPVYDSSLFTFPSVAKMDRADEEGSYTYSRGNNPTVNELERKLALLEGGERARCFATGMGAISAAVLSVVRAGDHIVCVNQVYGPAKRLMGEYLQRYGVETDFVDGSDLMAIEAAIRPNTKLLYLESPSSLLFELQNLKACAELARRQGIRTIIDNTWATPCYQNPLKYGIDMVVHSLTKYAGGHSDAMGGVVIGSEQLIGELDRNELVLLGAVMQPQVAALVVRGLRTLPLRMERHQNGAMAVAAYLASLPFLDRVRYPGLPSHPQHQLAEEQMSGYGGLLSFEAGLDREKLIRFIDQLTYFRIGFSWGGYESLVSLQERIVDPPGRNVPVVRLYIGLEEPGDLIRDLTAAFQSAGFHD
ncbi:trans-sulfuration enzyme family protein [Paenibacillus radicis (ex Gao et al. 2016)]|uniref:homocysteine desulfhydrase n=1 Tax=Paenibacillus radicis (ex Gao et al. 2016) TaxID=1737354 RepID=A0A917HGC0_9BACL|nr:PLP-dependent aspartate aminotransferase family protein [Paenibacillus radicis (ex Gao et al. 2016)]GGG78786.1 cystathionine gamma-synthase [Paenibacillus radicis (ex Gao et al. 2016)]